MKTERQTSIISSKCQDQSDQLLNASFDILTHDFDFGLQYFGNPANEPPPGVNLQDPIDRADLKRWARTWVAHGIPLLPLTARTKMPIPGVSWKAILTDDIKVIDGWIDEGHDLGAAMGHEVADGSGHLMAVDLDTKDGVSGAETLKTMVSQGGEEVPSACHQDSPSGGRHLFVTTPAPTSNSACKLGPCVDTRGLGGYVKVYAPLPDGSKPTAAPEWLVQRLKEATPETDRSRKFEAYDDLYDIESVMAYLRSTAPAIEGKGGDQRTYDVACDVRDFSISRDKCLELMDAYFNPRCEPEWEPRELDRKIRNAYAYAHNSHAPRSFRARMVGYAEALGEPELAHARLVNANDNDDDNKSKELTPADAEYWIERCRSENDYLAMPDPRWLIANVLPEKGTGILYGSWSAFKSFVILDLLQRVARGMDWAGNKTTSTPDVIYLTGEGEDDIKLRVAAWLEANDTKPCPRVHIFSELPNFRDEGTRQAFLTACKRKCGNVGLVVIDTVARWAGQLDENSAQDASELTKWMDAIRDTFDCFTFGVHHSGKDPSRGVRGSSATSAAVDLLWSATSTDADKTQFQTWLTSVKARRGRGWKDKLCMRGRVVPLGHDADGIKKDSLAFFFDPNAQLSEKDEQKMWWTGLANELVGDADLSDRPFEMSLRNVIEECVGHDNYGETTLKKQLVPGEYEASDYIIHVFDKFPNNKTRKGRTVKISAREIEDVSPEDLDNAFDDETPGKKDT